MSEKEKTAGRLLEEQLTFCFPHIGKEAPGQIEEAAAFCEGYKAFLNEGKTERECVEVAVKRLEAAGYTAVDFTKQYQPGDKVYFVNRKKAIIMTTFGQKPLKEGVRINGAHIDSPRLDLKPNPVYEKNDMAYFKTHYYGGIRKYQWGTTPLAMHGVVIKKNGESVKISIGEQDGDPVFCVSDLLPHLAAKQNERKLSDGLKGEELNVIIGSVPFVDDSVKEPVKLMALKLLHEKYGITEADFYRAEIEMVPAQKAVDVGLDRSMIGAYGQDDRICAYTAMMAEIQAKTPEYTTVTALVDKEEIGSVGATGMQSRFFENTVAEVLNLVGEYSELNVRRCLAASDMLSSDVSAAFDPSYASAFEKKNAAFFGRGMVFNKFTGARGKSGSNDANAEYVAHIRAIMEESGVAFQTAELGKIDVGGGGTIAYILALYGMNVIDCGVAVLSMHAPWEATSKADIYETKCGYVAFLEKACL